ncbi:MAG TPA: HDIG domain-containing protein, partial [Solirubrobacteraceae bacterium]|nr:HDIG domain-containing protein [Solirubrobacteraceae bacterium]
VRTALAGTPAWLVGGAVRDELLGRPTADVDVVVDGDPARAARAVAQAGGRAACFALSEEFGSWRVVARDRSWQVDVEPLRGETIEADLALRDFTVNAIARELSGGAPIDPLGGIADLGTKRLRMAGPGAFADDPLRVLRLVRVAVELEMEPDEQALLGAAAQAHGLSRISGERVFVELRRILATPHARHGVETLRAIGAMKAVLPELDALRGVEQSRFHHLDVYEHTLEVLRGAVELTSGADASTPLHVDARADAASDADVAPRAAELRAAIGEHGERVTALLAQPLADEMTRGEALRWGALLHDAAKPPTRAVRPLDGRVTFIGHDELGSQLARTVLTRLRASERLRAHVGGLVRHHLRAGFLVHDPQPLSRRTVFAYLRACSPVAVDVTLLSAVDRLATRGDHAEKAIERHMRVARQLLEGGLDWHADGPPRPLLRGDELTAELGIVAGPRVGAMLERLTEAQYAGEISTRADAVELARKLAKNI